MTKLNLLQVALTTAYRAVYDNFSITCTLQVATNSLRNPGDPNH